MSTAAYRRFTLHTWRRSTGGDTVVLGWEEVTPRVRHVKHRGEEIGGWTPDMIEAHLVPLVVEGQLLGQRIVGSPRLVRYLATRGITWRYDV